jgi:hypothetical protein
MTGILGRKKSVSWSKRKQTVSSDAPPTQQTPSKSSICALYLAILIQKIGLLSVHYMETIQVHALAASKAKGKLEPFEFSLGSLAADQVDIKVQ